MVMEYMEEWINRYTEGSTRVLDVADDKDVDDDDVKDGDDVDVSHRVATRRAAEWWGCVQPMATRGAAEWWGLKGSPNDRMLLIAEQNLVADTSPTYL